MLFMNCLINMDMWRKLNQSTFCKITAPVTYEHYEDDNWAQDSLQEYHLYDRCYQMEIQYYFPMSKIVKTSVPPTIKETYQGQHDNSYPYKLSLRGIKIVLQDLSDKIDIYETKIKRLRENSESSVTQEHNILQTSMEHEE